jgi:hypothetical protein
MSTIMEAEIGLANIDDCIADADSNLTQLGHLVAHLERNGYPTAEIERELTKLMKALQGVRAQRRTIVNALDGVEPPPRIARRRRVIAKKSPSGGGIWQLIYRPFSKERALPVAGRSRAPN